MTRANAGPLHCFDLDGLSAPVTHDPDLAYVTRWYSREQHRPDTHGHVDSRGWNPTDRVRAFDLQYISVGENSARALVRPQYDVATPEAVAERLFWAWNQSEGHWENLLGEFWEYSGVGIYVTDDDIAVANHNSGIGRPDIEGVRAPDG